MSNSRFSIQLQRILKLPREEHLLGDLAGGLGVVFCALSGAAPKQGFVTFGLLFALTWLLILELLKRLGGGTNGLLRKVSLSLAPICQMGRYWPAFYCICLFFGEWSGRWWRSIYLTGWGVSGLLRACFVFFAGNLILLVIECIGRLIGMGDEGADAPRSRADESAAVAEPAGPLTIFRLEGRDKKLGDILALVLFSVLFLRLFFNSSMITSLTQVLGWWDAIERMTLLFFRLGLFVGIMSLGALAEGRKSEANAKDRESGLDSETKKTDESARKEKAALALLGAFVLTASWLHYTLLDGHDIELLYFGIFFALAAGRKADHFVRISVILGIIVLVAAWKLSLEGYITYLVYAGTKHAMGMVYSTDLAAHLFGLVAAGCFLRRGKPSPLRFLFYVFVAEYFIWHITGCRNDTVAVALLLFGTFIYMFFDKAFLWLCKIFRYAMKYSYLIFFFGSLLLTVYYSGGSIGSFPGSETLAARFDLGRQGFEKYPITLIGTIVEEMGAGGIVEEGEYFFIDSSYVRMLLLFGILITAAFLTAMTVFQHRSVESGRYYVAFVCAVFALTAFVDHHICDPSYFILGILPLAEMPEEPDPTGFTTLSCLLRRSRPPAGSR